MTYDWIDKPKASVRPWRGRPLNRQLDADDLSWFSGNARARLLALAAEPVDPDDLGANIRRSFILATMGK